MDKRIKPRQQLVENVFEFKLKNKTNNGDWNLYHSHPGVEFLYIHQGEGNVIINNKIQKVIPGTLVISQPYQLHHMIVKSTPQKPYIRTPLIIDPYWAKKYFELFFTLKPFFYTIWKQHLPQYVLYLEKKQQEQIQYYFQSFEERTEGLPIEEKQEEVIILLISILRMLKKIFTEYEESGLPNPSRSNKRLVESLIEWIDENYNRQFSLQELADTLHVSPYYASHLFTQETGGTISQYVASRRVYEASVLLSTTSQSVTQIAKNIGFNSSSYFCKIFKKKTGLSPQAYRQKNS
ncbi:helix-turn-helix domain-containing protein [Rummeliibacillus sp. SL167]|uniref:AraC family transcriptional regulator n=1 Tax=Rummeliibacillus sp. SL167 TaxID=2579792 RepID=UPI0011B38E88|nr:helix-turn-helix domain-containing protein [Rummeliibacillus sp. SL167]